MNNARYSAHANENELDGWYINRYWVDATGTTRRDTVYDLLLPDQARSLANTLNEHAMYEGEAHA